MDPAFPPADLVDSLQLERRGAIALLKLDRAHKRNALDDATVLGLERVFTSLPRDVRVVVLHAAGEHFSAGLDLGELRETSTFDGILHSRRWHRAFECIERGAVPVIAVLKGAVVGGGLELAAATHLRVAEPSAFYAMPEATRGLYVGGGASVRVPRLIGVHRMMDLMLTGRVLSADEGHELGLSQYLTGNGEGLDKALALAARIAENSPISNYAVVNALPRIAQSGPDEGYMMESLMAAISQGSDEAKARMRAFLDGEGPRVRGGGDATTGSTDDDRDPQ